MISDIADLMTELQAAQCQAILFLTDGEADFTESDFASMLGKNSRSGHATPANGSVTVGGKWNATHSQWQMFSNVALAHLDHLARLAV